MRNRTPADLFFFHLIQELVCFYSCAKNLHLDLGAATPRLHLRACSQMSFTSLVKAHTVERRRAAVMLITEARASEAAVRLAASSGYDSHKEAGDVASMLHEKNRSFSQRLLFWRPLGLHTEYKLCKFSVVKYSTERKTESVWWQTKSSAIGIVSAVIESVWSCCNWPNGFQLLKRPSCQRDPLSVVTLQLLHIFHSFFCRVHPASSRVGGGGGGGGW